MLIQIQEPGAATGSNNERNNNEIVVGIDLGTTNSLVSIVENGNARVIPDSYGNTIHPSIVAYSNAGVLVGHEVINNNATNYISSVKRLIGREIKDIKKISGSLPFDFAEDFNESNETKIIRLNANSKVVTPIEVSAEILKHLKKIAEKDLGKEVKKSVITVPAYFDDSMRSATKAAAELAGLEVLRLINEPTSAALSYGLDNKAEGIYIVYDLGGGTFDVSVLKMRMGVFQVLATAGNNSLGGDDFDREIAELVLWQYKNINNDPVKPTDSELRLILKESRKIKELFLNKDIVEYNFLVGTKQYQGSITIEQFEAAIAAYINATIDCCAMALRDASTSKDAVKAVIVVGGSSRIRLVKKSLNEFFGSKLLDDIDPDLVVAKGAAMQADALSGRSESLLIDVLPLSLGIETVGGIVEKIIDRNTPIPVTKAQEFTTYKDNQTAMSLHVVQGEREIVADNRSLAKFELKNIPPMVAGAAKVRVVFKVDADGLLSVSATELNSSVTQHIEVKPSYGLTESEIKTMLYESMQFAKDDITKRLLLESKTEAGSLINAVIRALQEDKALLTEQQYLQISAKLKELEQATELENRDNITSLTKELSDLTQDFAEKRMDKYVAISLKGQKIDE